MLRVTQSASVSRAKSYYSTADYYSEGQELVGRWRGRGAERLGLCGVVDRARWDLLCDNRRPDGRPLTARRKSERRVGYDFNFHCPKSVSLLYGLTRDERILSAFRGAVGATMEDIEAEAKARVRRGGINEDRVTGNLVWGEFVHFTARPEAGVPDPHLHAHCFVFNATHDAHEGRWKAAQIGDLKRDAPYFEAVFHARLARRLEELGLETTRTAKGWELQGMAAATLRRFSRRTERIEERAREMGVTDPARKAELGARTRAAKVKAMGMPELEALWRSRLTPDEVKTMERLARRVGSAPLPEDRRIARDAAARAVEHCLERASVVAERTLLAEALRQGVGKASCATIEGWIGRQAVVRGERGGRTLVTTPEVLEEETRMLAFARRGRGACPSLAAHGDRCSPDTLNEDQRAALRHVLTSRDRVILVRGAAGTGKTTMMREAIAALEAAGHRVMTFAPSAGASRGVLRAEGFASADTVARLLLDPAMRRAAAGAVLWIDEAGLLGTRAMRELFDLAEQCGSRVVLSGDRRQHGSVQRGAALRLLEEEAGLRPAEMRRIQRQRGEYKAAVRALSEGRIAEGFHGLDRLGWVHESGGEDRDAALAAAYVETVRQGKTALVVSPTHAEGERITAAIRARLRADGLLGAETRCMFQLVPRNLTVAQRRDPASYGSGDVLVFHQNAPGRKKGERVAVGGAPLPLEHAERFGVFRRAEIELSPGDRVRITGNGTTADGCHRLNNGDLFTVKGFTPEGGLLLHNGWLVAPGFGRLAHGAVVTSHASQGKTVDRVFIGQSAESFAASSCEQFYVSVSRGRERATIFTDDKAELLCAVSRGEERLSATELMKEARARGVVHQRDDRERGGPERSAVRGRGRGRESEEITHER